MSFDSSEKLASLATASSMKSLLSWQKLSEGGSEHSSGPK